MPSIMNNLTNPFPQLLYSVKMHRAGFSHVLKVLNQTCQNQTAVRAAHLFLTMKKTLAGRRFKNSEHNIQFQTKISNDYIGTIELFNFSITFSQIGQILKIYCRLKFISKSKKITAGRQRQPMGPHAARGPPV